MVSTNFVQNKSISVNLLESREGAAVVSKQLEISVNAQGQYSLNGVSVEGNFASLVEMLEQQVQGLPGLGGAENRRCRSERMPQPRIKRWLPF